MAVQSSWNADALLAQFEAAAERGVFEGTEALLAQSDALVPIEEGTLSNSGLATADGLKGRVSYSQPYARRQHEEVGWRHANGRTAKYLERPANGFTEEFTEIVAGAIRREMT